MRHLDVVTVVVAVFSLAAGWRHDGTGRSAEGDSSMVGARDTAVVKVPLPSGGFSSPVVVGDQVYLTTEPTELMAVDGRTGAIRWRHDHPVLDALLEVDQRPARALASLAVAAEEELSRMQAEYGRLIRRARGGDEAAQATLEATSSKMDELRETVESAAHLRPSGIDPAIGYASPTPTADGSGVYALFGTGVLVARSPSGEVRWQRWLGPSLDLMRGFTGGSTASPILVDGTLVVGHNKLHAIDPATGQDRWVGFTWDHYAAAAPVEVEGTWYLATPGGELLRLSDGELVGDGLGDIWYVSPYVIDQTVIYAGGHSEGKNRETGTVPVVAWDLSVGSNGEIEHKARWSSTLDTADPVVSGPVSDGEELFVVTRKGLLYTLSLQTGEVLSSTRIDGYEMVYPSPVSVNDRLFLTCGNGAWFEVEAKPNGRVVREGSLDPMTASPVFLESVGWIRTEYELLGFRK